MTTTTSTYFSKNQELYKEQNVSKVLDSRVAVGQPSGIRLDGSFFNVPCKALAHKLLGQVLIRVLDNGQRLSGRIVETESYLGGEDKASHSYQGKRTPRNGPMFMAPGTAYVYITYGMYHCFNISSQEDGGAVLIRALEPLQGLDYMKERRGVNRKDGGHLLKDKDLCSGPSKLCQAMEINKELINGKDLVTFDAMWIEKGEQVSPNDIISTSRIGIGSSAGDWMTKPLRFYIRGNVFVSIKDKKAEL